MAAVIVAAGAAVVGAVSSITGGMSARKQARKAGRAASRFIKMETRETVRRQRIENKQTLGMAKAIVGASGTIGTGTSGQHIKTLGAEAARRVAWTQESGAMRAAAAKHGANVQGSQALTAGIQSGIQFGMQAYSFGQNIPKTPPSGATISGSAGQQVG